MPQSLVFVKLFVYPFFPPQRLVESHMQSASEHIHGSVTPLWCERFVFSPCLLEAAAVVTLAQTEAFYQ